MITYVVIVFLAMIISTYIYENKKGKYPKQFIRKKFTNNIFGTMVWGIIMFGLVYLAVGGICAIVQMQDISFASTLSESSEWTTEQWVIILDGFSISFTFLVCIGMVCLAYLANKSWDIQIMKYTDEEKEIIKNRKNKSREQFIKKCPILAKYFKVRVDR
jgi:flagellar biosynthesis protein FliR